MIFVNWSHHRVPCLKLATLYSLQVTRYRYKIYCFKNILAVYYQKFKAEAAVMIENPYLSPNLNPTPNSNSNHNINPNQSSLQVQKSAKSVKHFTELKKNFSQV